jgi:hypothetical protein
MMTEHLPKVFSSGFNVQDEDLLQRKCQFDKVIRLEEPIHFDLWIISPYFTDISPIWTMSNNVESDGKGDGVVIYIPCLLLKSDCAVRRRMRSKVFKERPRDESHEDCAKENKEEDPGENEGPVRASFIEQSSGRIKMRKKEEFGRVRLRNKQMCRYQAR